MGFHFQIVFSNSDTGDKEVGNFFSTDDYETAWIKVAKIAFDMLKGKCAENKYWFIQNITDVTRR